MRRSGHQSPALQRLVLKLLMAFALLVLPEASRAAEVDCTPTAGFTACKRITFSGSDQTFTVPTGITSISVRVWGAAGGGANSSFYQRQGGGAGGGFASAAIAVTPGQALTLVVGQGGIPNSTATTYGGGGQGGGSTASVRIGGSGGGMSAIFSSATKSAATVLVAAGGGGGASPGADGSTTTGAGGGGGATGGQDGVATRSGRGGTQVAGGAAATGTSACTVAQTAGALFQGGRGATSNGVNSNEGGGGGGGGYYGGGGGLCQNSGTQNGAGGGGSSFTGGTGVTGGSTTAGANFLYSGANCAGNANSGGSGDSFYTAGIGQGSCYGVGGNGEIVIQYRIATLRVSKVTVGNSPAMQVFSFSGDNGFGTANLSIPANTAGTPVDGTIKPLANSNTITTVSETVPTGYKLTAISCTGTGGGSASYNLGTASVELDATATANSNDVTCLFTNTKLPTLRISKISNGGTGTFNFSGSNGFGADSIPTTSPAVSAPGATKILSDASTITTITETIPTTYFISGIACTGLGGGSALTNNIAGTIVLDAGATAPGNVIECTYTNTLASPALSLVKSASTPGPVNAGDTITYTFKVTNTGNVPVTNISVIDPPTSFNGNGTLPAPANEGNLVDAVPTGDSSNGTANDGIWATLGPGDSIEFTSDYLVVQADIDNLQ